MYNYVIWTVVAICFVIIMSISILNFLRIGTLRSERIELDTSLNNTSKSNSEYNLMQINSNIDEMKADIRSNLEGVKSNQFVVDSNQDVLISKNISDIFNVDSNIINDINPKLLEFDGNFKSLDGSISSNKSSLDVVNKTITELNTQFNTQHAELSNDIKKINDAQFEDRIGKLHTAQTTIQNTLVGINVNRSSIAANKEQLLKNSEQSTKLSDDITLISGTLHDLSKSTLALSGIVDAHDLIIRTPVA